MTTIVNNNFSDVIEYFMGKIRYTDDPIKPLLSFQLIIIITVSNFEPLELQNNKYSMRVHIRIEPLQREEFPKNTVFLRKIAALE